VVDSQLDKQGKLFHADLRLSEARIMLGAPGPDARYAGPGDGRIHAMMLVYDDLFAKAVAAGATPLAEPADKPWGDRTCGFIDPQGQHWYFHRAPA
jgi:PhnB protein